VQQKVVIGLLGAVLFFAAALNLSAQGTAISYQGRLSDGGAPANTNYDFRFTVYSAPTNGTPVSLALTNFAVPVSNGLFSVILDFGPGVFNGTANGSNDWMDIGVRAIGVTNFTGLWPRQPILPVPYALFATSASNLLGSLQATQILGKISSSLISGSYSNSVNFLNGTNSFTGAFTGNGGGLTNLNASSLATGTLADALLPPDVALLGQNQVFTGSNSFTGPGTYSGVNTFNNNANSFNGNFYGNGLVGWGTVSGPATNAVRDHGYLLLSPAFTTVTLPTSALLSAGDIIRVAGGGAGGWQVKVNAGQSIIGSFATYKNSFLQVGATGNDWRRVCCSADGSRMYAGGTVTSAGVQASSDSGHTWSGTGITGTGWYSVACSADGTKVYAAPNGGIIKSSSDAGITFPTSIGSSANWIGIACSGDGSKYIAAPASGSLQLSSGSSPASGNWTAVACSADGNNFAAALGNVIYSSISGPSSWRSPVTLPGPLGNCYALAAANNGLKLVAACNGGIGISTNFGATWTTTTPASGLWSCVAGSSDCSELVAGVSNGLFYASGNFGATWSAMSTTNQFWSGACMSADGTKIAATTATVGIAGAIFYSSTSAQPNVTSSSSISGGLGSAVELQYIGNNQFIPVSSSGILWAN
jgi:hypothetical protein